MKQYRVKIYKSATSLVDATYAAASSGEAADAAVSDFARRNTFASVFLPQFDPIWSRTPYHKTTQGENTPDILLYTFADTNTQVSSNYVLSVEVTEVVDAPNELEQLLQSINALTLEVKRKQQELTDKYKQLRKLMRAG